MRTAPSIDEAVEKIGIPVAGWKGNCYAIACKLVEARLAGGGVAIYNHWTGPIAPGSFFAHARGSGFCQHGWVLLPSGQVLDPTRWVFEGAEPYIYLGPADHYDEGGNLLRGARIGPPPPFDPDDEVFDVTKEILDTAPYMHAEGLLDLDWTSGQEPGQLTKGQLRWLANVPFSRLGHHAMAIYLALEKLEMRGFVPIDNWKRAEREAALRGDSDGKSD